MAMSINMEDDLERNFIEVCHEMGLSCSTVISIFARAVVRERAIPLPHSDVSSFERAAQAYELSIADGIRRGLTDVAAGNVFTRDQARAMRAARMKA